VATQDDTVAPGNRTLTLGPGALHARGLCRRVLGNDFPSTRAYSSREAGLHFFFSAAMCDTRAPGSTCVDGRSQSWYRPLEGQAD
jgi:hypothetical protein